MRDFETRYHEIRTGMAKVDTAALTFWGKAHAAAQAWPYWAPMVLLAAVAGHCL